MLSDKKFEFQPEEDGTLSLESAVFQALGAGSMCWVPVPSGIFDSTRAKEIGDAMIEKILDEFRKYVHDELDGSPLLGLATTFQLLEEVAVRMEITQNSTNGRNLGRTCREAMDKLDANVLKYRSAESG